MTPFLERCWRAVLGFTIETACVTFSITWGSWLLCFYPLKYIPGLRFLVYFVAGWCPLDANVAWGGAILLLGMVRTWLMVRNKSLTARATFALLACGIYLTITSLIALDSYSSTGIPCYS